MRLIMFSIHDQKAEAFMTPFFQPTVGLAERMFTQAVNDQDSTFHNHAADYNLFEIGTFEMDNAEVTLHAAPINRGSALQFRINPAPAAVVDIDRREKADVRESFEMTNGRDDDLAELRAANKGRESDAQ